MGCFESLDNTLEREIRSAEEILQLKNYSLSELFGAFYGKDLGNGLITIEGIHDALTKIQWLNPSLSAKVKYRLGSIRENFPSDWNCKLPLMEYEKKARAVGCEVLNTILSTIEHTTIAEQSL